jgi:hypothetical protein
MSKHPMVQEEPLNDWKQAENICAKAPPLAAPEHPMQTGTHDSADGASFDGS